MPTIFLLCQVSRSYSLFSKMKNACIASLNFDRSSPSFFDLLVICMSRTSPVVWTASLDKTNAGLRLVSVPSENGKSTETMSPWFAFMVYFNRLSHRASSLPSHSLAKEVSLMEASSRALFFAWVRGLTFSSLFACNNFRKARPSGLRSLIVSIYSAIIQKYVFYGNQFKYTINHFFRGFNATSLYKAKNSKKDGTQMTQIKQIITDLPACRHGLIREIIKISVIRVLRHSRPH